jgi:ribosomal protein S18 acetylase RimI-like enzyme
MVKIADYEPVLQAISNIRSLKKGFITNCYLDKTKVELWSRYNLMFIQQYEEVTFLLKKQEGFYNLYFFATSAETLQNALLKFDENYKEETLAADILGNDTVLPIKQMFQNNGFREYTSLVRMNRLGNIDNLQEVSEELSEAGKEDANGILDLLVQHFDPLAEQIPLLTEIEEWISKGNILVCKQKDKIIGFIIYDLNGVTLYLRYWFVHPDYRDQKIGSKLFNFFYHKGQNTKRQIFWVIESNENAIKRYKHFGFTEEKMFDYILIKNKK